MSISQKNSTSLGFFNAVRGLGILWIIAGHSMAQYAVLGGSASALPVFTGAGRVLGSGLLAMFFMISGFYFFRRSPKKCISIQARLLLKPYYITGLAILIAKGFLFWLKGMEYGEFAAGLTLTWLLGINVLDGRTLLGIPLKTISIFWFLLALFGGWVLFNLIMHQKKRPVRVCSVVLCVVASWVLTRISKVWVAALPAALLAVGYIAVGYLIRKHNLLERKLPVWAWIAIGLPALVSLAFGSVDIASGTWKLGLLDMAGSFCVSFLMMRLYYVVSSKLSGGFLTKALEQMGLYSIWIICLHAFEKEIIYWKKLAVFIPDRPVLCMILCFAGRCIVMYLLYVILFGIRKLIASRRRPKIQITEE